MVFVVYSCLCFVLLAYLFILLPTMYCWIYRKIFLCGNIQLSHNYFCLSFLLFPYNFMICLFAFTISVVSCSLRSCLWNMNIQSTVALYFLFFYSFSMDFFKVFIHIFTINYNFIFSYALCSFLINELVGISTMITQRDTIFAKLLLCIILQTLQIPCFRLKLISL